MPNPDLNPERWSADKETIVPLGRVKTSRNEISEEQRIANEAHDKLVRQALEEADDD
jgi:hypothetical protein